jgi:hypothetical protein
MKELNKKINLKENKQNLEYVFLLIFNLFRFGSLETEEIIKK